MYILHIENRIGPGADKRNDEEQDCQAKGLILSFYVHLSYFGGVL